MKVTIDEASGVLIVRPQENITFGNFTDFKQQVEQAVERAEQGLVLDCTEISFICSTGIGVIANAYNTLKKREGRLVLLKPREEILRIFKVIGFDRLMQVSQDEAEAVTMVKGEASKA